VDTSSHKIKRNYKKKKKGNKKIEIQHHNIIQHTVASQQKENLKQLYQKEIQS